MDTGAWQATVHGVQTVAHDLATKQQSPPLVEGQEYILGPDNQKCPTAGGDGQKHRKGFTTKNQEHTRKKITGR